MNGRKVATSRRAWLNLPVWGLFASVLWLPYQHDQPLLPFSACFLTGYLMLLIVHEAAHAGAAVSAGFRIVGLRLGWMSLSVKRVRATPATNLEQARIAASGPIAQAVGAALVLPLAGGNAGLLVAVWLSLAEAVLNLAIPVGPFDGRKLTAALGACVEGQGGAVFDGRRNVLAPPEEPAR